MLENEIMKINNFKLLIEAKKAYRYASFSKIIYRVFKESNLKFKFIIALVTLLIMSLTIIIIFSETHPLFLLLLLVVEMFFLGTLFYCLENELKKHYSFIYNKYSNEFNIYNHDRIYFRYVIFRSKLLSENKNFIEHIENIQKLFEKENKFFNISIFKQYPVISALLVILTALVNGMASQTYLWENGILVVILYIIILLLSFSFFFAESLKSKDYYDQELDLFLTWIKNDFEVKTPNKD